LPGGHPADQPSGGGKGTSSSRNAALGVGSSSSGGSYGTVTMINFAYNDRRSLFGLPFFFRLTAATSSP
jgi:hypothetical protein